MLLIHQSYKSCKGYIHVMHISYQLIHHVTPMDFSHVENVFFSQSLRSLSFHYFSIFWGKKESSQVVMKKFDILDNRYSGLGIWTLITLPNWWRNFPKKSAPTLCWLSLYYPLL